MAVLAAFVLLMTLAHCIPNSMVAYHQETSKTILSMESEWIWFGNFFGVDAGRLDNTTDNIMVDGVIIQDDGMSPLQAAMSVNGYSRYWHGYLVFLRPLMIWLNYWQIRYVNMFVFFLLVCAVFRLIGKRVGAGGAYSFAVALIACYIVIIPVSMQYISVFLVMLCSMAYMLIRYERMDMPLFFMIVGMVTNFVDFLTAPILTLGMPLLLCLYMDIRCEEERPWRWYLGRIFTCSLLWGIGYGLCWASKWLIGTMVLGESVFESAAGHASYWTQNNWGNDRIIAAEQNFAYFFLAQGKRVFFPFVPVILGGIVCAACFRSDKWKRAFCLVPVCTYPYVWYMVLANHSLYHTWFTNRAQAITLFGGCLFLCALTDGRKLRDWLQKRKKQRV